jgi:hypothetical protein
VVGSDEESVSVGLASLVNLANSLVGLGHSLDSRLVHTSVANHVRRGEVVHDKLVFALGNTLSHLLGDSHGGHLGLLVVSGDLGRRDHVAVLAIVLHFLATVEEESDVSVLLGLGDVRLLDALLGEPVGEHVVHDLGRKGDGEGEVGLVAGHGGDVDVLGVGEVGLGAAVLVAEKLGDLADTVGAVVEEEDGVVVLDAGLLAVDNDGLDELVGLASLVALGKGCDRVARLLTLAGDKTLHADLDAVPALVAVHDVVTADNRRDLTKANLLGEGQQVLEVTLTALGVAVAAVTKEVNVDLGHTNLLSDLEERLEVVDVRVHTAIRDQTAKVQSTVALLGPLEAPDHVLDLVHLAILDGFVNADHVLPHNPAGTNVQVADLGVAHEALGETNGEGRGIDLGVALGVLAAILGELIHPGSLSVEDSIALGSAGGRSDSPAVDADKSDLLVDHVGRGCGGSVLFEGNDWDR